MASVLSGERSGRDVPSEDDCVCRLAGDGLVLRFSVGHCYRSIPFYEDERGPIEWVSKSKARRIEH
jgi:hypothetical protein